MAATSALALRPRELTERASARAYDRGVEAALRSRRAAETEEAWMPVSMTLPDIRALAGRLHARGTVPIGSDSSPSQVDMLAASQVIRALLVRSITASEAAGQLALQLSGPVEIRG